MPLLLESVAIALAEQYTIERELGRGGMATVYLAGDRKHARQVAIKVLDPDLGATLGAERFLAEIRVTAKLHHPNLLPLFDSGASGGLLFYVMPYVRGETLRARLSRERELAIEEALRLSTAIGAALEHAHREGVLHRDLKPENILLQDGQPVVADFGIALAVSNASGTRATQTGLSLGTPQYMSPEQAAGDRQLDARSDQYALASMCYEMLTGEPPHVGMNVAATMAKLMTETPAPLRARRDRVPAHVEWAVAKALSKRPADRFVSVAEFTRALATSGAYESAVGVGPIQAATVPRRSYLFQAIPWVVAIGAIAFAARPSGTAVETGVSAPVRVVVRSPESAAIDGGTGKYALSVDGTDLYYVSSRNGRSGIVRRNLIDDSMSTVRGSEGASELRLSPDGSRFLIMRGGGAVLLPRAGGVPQALPLQAGRADWLDDETLVFENAQGGLSMFAIEDGTMSPLTDADSTNPASELQSQPLAIANGRYALFLSRPADIQEAWRVGIVDVSKKTERLLELRGVTPVGFVNGHLVYVDDAGRLSVRSLDLGSGALGSERVIDPNVETTIGGVSVVVNRSGALLYLAGVTRTLIERFDVSGTSTVLDTIDARGMSWPRLSPDGTRLLGHVRRDTISDSFVYDLQRRTFTRVTFGRHDFSAHWLPDGNRFVVSSARDGARGIWLEYTDRSQPPRKLFTGSGVVADVSSDGRHALINVRRQLKYLSIDDGTVTDPPGGPLEIRAVGLESVGALSSDRSVLAYTARPSGASAVYVRALATGATLQVSREGASHPEFLRDGRLAYRDGARHLVTRIRLSPTLAAEEPQVLDSIDIAIGSRTPDGRAFVRTRAVRPPRELVVVLNWARLIAEGGRH